MDSIEQIMKQIDEKIVDSQSYEALQFLQSFIARKKRAMGRSKTSLCVFHCVRRLVERGSSGDAGVLLLWFIESDELFHLDGSTKSVLSADEAPYCDLERMLVLLRDLTPDKSVAVVDQIYGPLHQVVAKAGMARAASVSARMSQLEQLSATVFEATKKWHSAYKVVMRLGELERAARVLNSWAAEGYKNEKPLFFGRAVMQLLSERKVQQAEELVRHCTPLLPDNISPPQPGGPCGATQAVWHLATILCGLAVLPPQQRVDKSRLFTVLKERYTGILIATDPRLVELLQRVGAALFSVALPAEMQGPNPMEMLQKMMMASGGMSNALTAPSSSGRGQEPAFDMGDIMRMMSRLEGMKARS